MQICKQIQIQRIGHYCTIESVPLTQLFILLENHKQSTKIHPSEKHKNMAELT